MKKNILFIIIPIMLLYSCGYGIWGSINKRPKPWIYPYNQEYTGLDTLININGFYTAISKEKEHMSIMFYEDGLCLGLRREESLSTLDTIFSNNYFTIKNKNIFYECQSLWGTYTLNNDTINTYLIVDVSGSPETRKKIIINTFTVVNNKLINSADDTLNFCSIKNKKDPNKCPYLKDKWFYRKDEIKR